LSERQRAPAGKKRVTVAVAGKFECPSRTSTVTTSLTRIGLGASGGERRFGASQAVGAELSTGAEKKSTARRSGRVSPHAGPIAGNTMTG
jgi:hypothetical protein